MLNPNFPAASAHAIPDRLIGTIDAGSNAIRYAVYQLDEKFTPVMFHQKRYPVRLGAGTFADGRLNADDMENAVAAFRDIASHAQSLRLIALLAVATSAVRDASNGGDFVNRVRAETGIEVRVISGEEEAALVAEGIQVWEDEARERLIIDVGGGSTEIICHHYDEGIMWCKSLPLGAVRLGQLVGMPVRFGLNQMQQIRDRITAVLDEEFGEGSEISADIYGLTVGGTGRALAIAINTLESNEPVGAYPGVIEIRRGRLAVDAMAGCSPEDFPVRFGVDGSRAGIMVPGSLLLLDIMERFGLAKIHVSESSVREGLVRRYVRENGLG